MKILKKQNVFEAALERTRWIFDEFEEVVVSFSGGKDSTVCLNLALMVAEEKGRLPLKVLFIDQEAEWQNVIDYVRKIMYDPRVDPMWCQMPLRISNGTSANDPWLYCWAEDKENVWMRPKDDIAMKENKYKTLTFKTLFNNIIKVEFDKKTTCNIGGVRTEESPTRFLAMTSHETYKGRTWGKILDRKRGHYNLYPIYDWSLSDVWKAIHDNGWEYCPIYDFMYQYGVAPKDMRVSNVHHETAVVHLFYLQEIEPHTWNKLCTRVQGIRTAGKMGRDDFFMPKTLPFMFTDWKDYRDYLLEHLIEDPVMREKYRKKFASMDEIYGGINDVKGLYREHVNTLFTNDYHFTKLENFERRPEAFVYKKWKEGGTLDPNLKKGNLKHIPVAHRPV